MPFILGLPFIGSLISASVTALLTFFVSGLAAKFLKVALTIGLYLFLFFAFAYSLESLLEEVSVIMPSSMVEGVMTFFPTNSTSCLSVILLTRVATFIFYLKSKLLDFIE